MTRRIPFVFLFATFCALFAACAAFRGNTRKDFGDYDIVERQQYKHYLDNKAVYQRDRDSKILKTLATEEETARQAGREIKGREFAKPPVKPDPSVPEKKKKNREYSFPARLVRRLFRLED